MTARSTRWGGGLLTAALVVSIGGLAGPAGAAPGADEPTRGTPTHQAVQPARTVTLLTGDRITVNRHGNPSVRPGPGRTGIPIQAYRRDGRLHVVPADAVPLVRAGQVDARLFDVTTLLEFGYDDRRTDLPLILTSGASGASGASGVASAGGAARSAAVARRHGAEVVRELSAVDGAAVRAAKPRLADLWRDIAGGAGDAGARRGLSTVWLDGLRKPTLEHSVPQIGAPAAWQAGLDGAGVTVAVLDSGIDADHPDLAGQVVGQANFTEGEEDDLDRYGHGTHVASTIAGTGAASEGRNRGVAPGAKLLDGKVCAEFGCAESWILAGMQWAAEQGATVVNLSLGGMDGPEVDPVEEAVNTLTAEHGTLFVISAGNAGAEGTVGSPASADAALAVGAVDRDDNLADFSSRGPRVGDGGLKPEITAPGVEIVAARSSDAFPGETPEPYVAASGTSMSAPHVAGAAAIVAQRYPQLRGPALKATLMAAAVPHPDLSVYAQGAGRVDVARAVNQTLVTDPPSIGFDRQLWPHDDDSPATETVTYTNSGTSPTTLDLAVTATGPQGAPAPAGMFTLSTSTVTVPAGGTVEVTVTADTRITGPDGHYTGRLVASAGGTPAVQTPLAIDREVESYDVTVTHRNRAGAETTNYRTALFADDGVGLRAYDAFSDTGTATVRLPKGRYTLLSFVGEDEPAEQDPEHPVHQTSLLAQPTLEVAGATTVTVDAAKAGEIAVTVPRADAERYFAEVSAELQRPEAIAGFSLLGFVGDTLYAGQLGDSAPVDGFASRVSGVWAEVDEEGSPAGSPYLYQLGWFRDGGLFTGLTRTIRPADLATVRSRYARHVTAPDSGAWTGDTAILPGVIESGWTALMPFTTPFERTDYFNTDGGVQWDRMFEEWVRGEDGWEETFSFYEESGLRYRPGTVTRAQWNQGVFGPSLAQPRWPEAWVSRLGDEILVAPPMFGDGAGRPGGSRIDSASVTVYRDDVKIGESPETGGIFEVPAAEAGYRVEVKAERGAPFTHSTRVEGTWTFRSGHVTGEEPARLPLSSVRFSPPLNQANAAPTGRWFGIPVSVERQPDSGAAGVRSLKVDVSYDDGRTWRKATVLAFGGSGVVLVQHPDRAGFVSLRADATDRAGNTVRQTVIRAYAITR
ncbi:S8 family serine peptidase [Plantactinospora sp. B5E13]|uniref:S8 family serine peptidase n=1 Tax=unclassified Plantactinospora TaxID=2631981 RepID=UPI00325F2228